MTDIQAKNRSDVLTLGAMFGHFSKDISELRADDSCDGDKEPGMDPTRLDSKEVVVETVEDDSSDPIERRYLFRRPRALQYFERGVLRKAQDKERVSGRFELFYDLLYVALVSACPNWRLNFTIGTWKGS